MYNWNVRFKTTVIHLKVDVTNKVIINKWFYKFFYFTLVCLNVFSLQLDIFQYNLLSFLICYELSLWYQSYICYIYFNLWSKEKFWISFLINPIRALHGRYFTILLEFRSQNLLKKIKFYDTYGTSELNLACPNGVIITFANRFIIFCSFSLLWFSFFLL